MNPPAPDPAIKEEFASSLFALLDLETPVLVAVPAELLKRLVDGLKDAAQAATSSTAFRCSDYYDPLLADVQPYLDACQDCGELEGVIACPADPALHLKEDTRLCPDCIAHRADSLGANKKNRKPSGGWLP